jgi:membrane fusion protein (multidrug efflux system)
VTRTVRFIVPLLFVTLGCRGAGDARTTAKEAPPLPADVQDVARAVALRPAAPAPEGEPAPEIPASTKEGRLTFSGEFASPMQSDVAARITGRVGAVHASEGQRVHKGQPLLTLETEYLELDVEKAEAELLRAKAAAVEAGHELGRKQSLLAKGSVPQSTFDRAQAAEAQAQASLKLAEAGLGTARQRLKDATVTSPVDGVVIARRADAGESIGDSTVTFVVAQTAPLRLRFRVPERYLGQIEVGQKVVATVDPYPGEVFEGRTTLVGEGLDAATRTFIVEAEFANRDGRLKPGLFARIELDLDRPAGSR